MIWQAFVLPTPKDGNNLLQTDVQAGLGFIPAAGLLAPMSSMPFLRVIDKPDHFRAQNPFGVDSKTLDAVVTSALGWSDFLPKKIRKTEDAVTKFITSANAI